MIERNDIVKSWIEKGDHDLGTAQVTFLYIPQFRDTIAFHCQQAVEKYLKAFLFFNSVVFKRTHNLNYLLSLASQFDSISDDLYDKAAELEDFSVEIRYPNTSIDLSIEDIQQALTIAREFRTYVLGKMGLDISYEDIVKES
jgi:HEPN domain-containing protein